MQPWRFPLARGLLVDTRESIRKTFMGLYARERLDRITVTAICPGPTATGFEASAAMGSGSTMFQHAASAADVARHGIAAMRAGKAICLEGMFTKVMAVGSRLVPRAIARKLAMRMNR